MKTNGKVHNVCSLACKNQGFEWWNPETWRKWTIGFIKWRSKQLFDFSMICSQSWSQGHFQRCPLWSWPLTLKISMVQPLNMGNVCQVWSKYTQHFHLLYSHGNFHISLMWPQHLTSKFHRVHSLIIVNMSNLFKYKHNRFSNVWLVGCGLTSHSAIFQLFSNGRVVQFPNLYLLLGTQCHRQLGFFSVPSLPDNRTWAPGRPKTSKTSFPRPTCGEGMSGIDPRSPDPQFSPLPLYHRGGPMV